jgi:signal transduction histidine kinase
MSTKSYLRSIRGGRTSARRLRKRNLQRSLNESTNQLRAHLKDAIRIVRRAIRGLRGPSVKWPDACSGTGQSIV